MSLFGAFLWSELLLTPDALVERLATHCKRREGHAHSSKPVERQGNKDENWELWKRQVRKGFIQCPITDTSNHFNSTEF